ncbi:MAG: malto-oligosyltrehalose trehalohydrolase [Rhodospirillales bacterium]|nr:malto-oligosyltrehalose trehalohydrolase [Rhodospirillales bacterium]
MSAPEQAAPRHGATVLPDGRVAFALWAPAQESVSVAIEDGPLLPMIRSPEGWFTAEAPCPAGTAYRYRLADGMEVPDPASRAQQDDVHGPSLVVDPGRYAWKDGGWRGKPWRDTVLYELHAGTAGGFKGIQERIGALRALGITAIELMPVNDFPGRHNWGYDGVLPYAPDRAYGTPDELRALVDAAHAQDMMVFLDVVYNHFGPDGNYISVYAPSFFRSDVKTPWGSAIDFRRPEVRSYFTDNVMMWLSEYHFDGLRFDAVHAITEQDWVEEMAARVRTAFADRNVHLVLEHHNDASHLARQVDAQWNDDAHNVLHVLLTGETGGYYADYAEDTTAKLVRCLTEGWVYQGEYSAFLKGDRGSPSADLPPTAHVLFVQNHDQTGNRAFGERLTVLCDPAALEAAIALQLLCPQIPLIFMGEEEASRTPFLFFTDHGPELAEAVRNGRREEFASFAAFADPEKRETIPDPNAPETFSASIPQPDPELGPARRALYQRLLALRTQELVPFLDGARSEGGAVVGPKAVTARWRLQDGSLWSLACNLDAADVAFDALPGRQLFASRDAPAGQLPGYCTIVNVERGR